MKYLWKKATASFLALVMLVSMVPAASAASADISETVDAGETLVLGRSDFETYYEEEADMGDEPAYLVFDSYDDFDDYGYFTAKDHTNTTRILDDSDLDNADFFFTNSEATMSGEYRLSSLSFKADSDADDGTIELDFTIYGEGSDDDIEGVLKITVDGDSSSSSGSADITLEIEADDYSYFDEEAFYDLFDEEYPSEDLEYVKFTDSTDLDKYGYLYGYDYDDDDDFHIDEDDLTDYRFYYDSDDEDDYLLEDLAYYPDEDASDEEVILEFRMYGESGSTLDGTMTIEIVGDGESSSSSSDEADIEYEVDPDDEIDFDGDDFNDFFKKTYKNNTLKYVRFTDTNNLTSSNGYIYYDYDKSDEVRFTANTLDDAYFYYDDADVDGDDEYPLDDLTFVASDDFEDVITLDFTAYYSSSKKVSGTLTITSTEADTSSGSSSSKADITYKVKPDAKYDMDPDDFNDVFQDKYSSYDFEYLIFTDYDNVNAFTGDFYYKYGKSSSEKLSASKLDDYVFYYDDSHSDIDEDDGYFALEDISFVASTYFGSDVTLKFRAYYSSTRYVDGTLVITPDGVSTSATASNYVGSVRYSTTGTNVQINANDIARYFSSVCPGYSLQYVTLSGAPATGSLYYNYYGTGKYGATARTQITAYNAGSYSFYASPASASQYALTELTYVPSGRNYCTAIPFMAYGTGGRAASGAILISVTSKAVPEVYGVTLKNTAYTFPASSVYSAVATATSSALSSIQLLALPSATAGTLYVGSGTTRANTSTRYTYGSGSYQMSSLRFVPATGFTGNVEIPYVALNAAGTAIASGTFSLGVVNSVKKFSDMTSSTWCYKYVTELSADNVISGYNDGTFKPNSTITYGAALKLITLAAGHGEKAPTGSHTFSGYLSYAQQKGWITRSNVNLSGTITRQQMAQLAASALGLNTTNLSSVKPFTDTTDASVQALNAAGIIEGYFANGTSTFKPNNTLTRGQMSAIVWRMQNMK